MPEPTNNFSPPTPVFRVKDVDASVAYYMQALEFEVRFRRGLSPTSGLGRGRDEVVVGVNGVGFGN